MASHALFLYTLDDACWMRWREASINDIRVDESERRIFGPRPPEERGRENLLR